jgi:integrase
LGVPDFISPKLCNPLSSEVKELRTLGLTKFRSSDILTFVNGMLTQPRSLKMSVQVISDPVNTVIQVSQDHAATFHDYTKKKLAGESRRAYSFGWQKFQTWIQEHSYSLRSDANHIAFLVGAFLSDMAKSGALKYKSLVAYHAAIKSHVRDLYRIELDHPEIRSAMKGIRNDLKQAPVKKEAVKAEHVSAMVTDLKNSNRLIDLRDRALLLLGFSGAFRRSELIGIDVEHVAYDGEGISINIPHSKTDQIGAGQHIEIPRKLSAANCPIAALNDWLTASGITGGAIFRSINRHGAISSTRLTGKSVADIVKKRGEGIFEDTASIAGHSLRRGFVMSSLEADVSVVSIMNQTRHASVNTLKEYSSERKNYKTNALNSINL